MEYNMELLCTITLKVESYGQLYGIGMYCDTSHLNYTKESEENIAKILFQEMRYQIQRHNPRDSKKQKEIASKVCKIWNDLDNEGKTKAFLQAVKKQNPNVNIRETIMENGILKFL